VAASPADLCQGRELVERGVFVVELDLGHLEPPAPLGLVPQTILERTAGALLGDEELYRFRVVNRCP